MAEGSRSKKHCNVCGKPANPSNPLSEEIFWCSPYCREHEHDNTPRYFNCYRFQGRGVRYVDVGDGRMLCPDCLSTSIMDTQKCERLARKLYAFFNDTLNLKFETRVPVLLVDKEEIHRCVRRHTYLRPQPNQKHQTWGTIATIPRKINTVTKCARKGDEIEVVKKVERVTVVGETWPNYSNGYRTGGVAAVVILYGLPMVTTGSIMAHEMMHAWIRLQGWYHSDYYLLKRKVEEGICQLISHMWLERFASDVQFTKSLRELGIFRIENVEGEDKEIYGDGFREAKKAVDEYGLETTLKHIAITGRFDPPPAKVGCCCF